MPPVGRTSDAPIVGARLSIAAGRVIRAPPSRCESYGLGDAPTGLAPAVRPPADAGAAPVAVTPPAATPGVPPLSVVLVCHDERPNLPRTLAELLGVLADLAPNAEIIVVDDGSTDGTLDVIPPDPAILVRTARHPRRLGYGRAVRTGLEEARGRWVAYLDGDGQYRADELAGLLARLETDGADVVAGVRADRSDPAHRRLLARIYNDLVRRVTGLDYVDVDCGFKVLRREVLDAVELRCDGNLFGAELVAKAHRAGFRIVQVPVTHRPRRHGRAKGADAFAVAHSVRELIHHWRELVG